MLAFEHSAVEIEMLRTPEFGKIICKFQHYNTDVVMGKSDSAYALLENRWKIGDVPRLCHTLYKKRDLSPIVKPRQTRFSLLFPENSDE